ncbi:MAG: hypothetical protein V3V82_04395, partial [Acidimicrobiia bacterium]
MTVEQLLTDALHGADDYLPSPDLFAKVKRSIEEDAAHQRRVRHALTWAAVGLAAAVAWVAAFIDFTDGTATMPWWTVEVLTAAILIPIVVVLGPVIRRFGQELTTEIFRSNRATSERFLVLVDIAYYLIFTAFILMTTNFSAQAEWGGELADQLELELVRIGGLLLLMGILHALTIAVLPVMGLIFASNWRRAARMALGSEAPEPNPPAEKADRVATVIVWLVAA